MGPFETFVYWIGLVVLGLILASFAGFMFMIFKMLWKAFTQASGEKKDDGQD